MERLKSNADGQEVEVLQRSSNDDMLLLHVDNSETATRFCLEGQEFPLELFAM